MTAEPALFTAFSFARRRFAGLRSALDRRDFHRDQGRRLAMRAAQRLMPVAESMVDIEHDRHGRPYIRVAGTASDVDVSISHSGAYVAAAAVRGARVGIDIEPLSDIPARCWRFFLTEPEAQACARRPRRALWAWTIKEAAFKAHSTDLPLRFKEIHVDGWEDRCPQVAFTDDIALRPTVFLREHLGCAIAIVVVRP